MASTSIRASAPGSLVLVGEHTVLRGGLCLVTAIDRRLEARLVPRTDGNVRLESALGTLTTGLDAIQPREPYTFALAAIGRFRDRLPGGFDLHIESSMPADAGLGTSAAATVATVAALGAWVGEESDANAVFDHGLAAVREVQQLGSGADVAAAVHGGIVAYRAEPREIEPLPPPYPPLTILYSGAKTPTVEVVRFVDERRQDEPGLYAGIDRLIDEIGAAARDAVRNHDWPGLGRLFDINQGLLDAMGVNTATLSEMVYRLRDEPVILGAKISGSGLGDCVIGLGSADTAPWPWPTVPAAIGNEGVRVD